MLFECLHASTWNDVGLFSSVSTVQMIFEKTSFILHASRNVSIFFFFFNQCRSKKISFFLLLFSHTFVTRPVQLRTHFTYTFDLFSRLFSLSPVQMDMQFKVESKRQRKKWTHLVYMQHIRYIIISRSQNVWRHWFPFCVFFPEMKRYNNKGRSFNERISRL